MCEKRFITHAVQGVTRSSTNQWRTGEGAAMIPWRDIRCDCLGEQHRSDWKAGSEGLGERQQIRFHPTEFVGKETPCTAQAALHFIEDKERPDLVAPSPQGGQKI